MKINKKTKKLSGKKAKMSRHNASANNTMPVNSVNPIGSITVLPIHYPVRFGEGFKVEGKITAVRISAYSVMYEISFWRGEEYKTQILPSSEIAVPDTVPPVITVGFGEHAIDKMKAETNAEIKKEEKEEKDAETKTEKKISKPAAGFKAE